MTSPETPDQEQQRAMATRRLGEEYQTQRLNQDDIPQLPEADAPPEKPATPYATVHLSAEEAAQLREQAEKPAATPYATSRLDDSAYTDSTQAMPAADQTQIASPYAPAQPALDQAPLPTQSAWQSAHPAPPYQAYDQQPPPQQHAYNQPAYAASSATQSRLPLLLIGLGTLLIIVALVLALL